MIKRNIHRLFEARKANLDYRVNRDFIRNGIATIPCRITHYNDVISRYSVKGYESLNPEFVDYIKSTADVTPSECPLVLNIIGDCLSQEEKKTIHEIIRDDFAYELGMVEKDVKRHARTFVFMFVALVVLGAALWLTKSLFDEARELIFILFWFMGDTLCDYIFLSGYDLRRGRRLAGRLASIKVVFSDHFEDPHYTEKDVERIYSEIEQDVNESIQEAE